LDDSANRRTILPEPFLIADELLLTGERIINAWVIHETAMIKNLDQFAPFAATEGVLMALSKAGADRQSMHERLRNHALEAWAHVMRGEPNPLLYLVETDEIFQRYLSQSELQDLMLTSDRLGLAPERARNMAESIRQTISSEGDEA
jgi:adenylosuccinate lyase